MHLSGRRWNRLSACGRKRKINPPETRAILEQAFCQQAKSFPNDVLPYYAEDTRTLKLQELRERYAEPVAPPESYLVSGTAGCICPADGGTDCQRVAEKGKSILLKQE